MSLVSAINEARAAASHARPFLKLMDALSNLEGELRAANAAPGELEAVKTQKAELEKDIPALREERDGLQKQVTAVANEIRAKRQAAEEEVARFVKESNIELQRAQSAIRADHDTKLAEKKSELAALQSSIDELVGQKTKLAEQIKELREKARAVLTA